MFQFTGYLTQIIWLHHVEDRPQLHDHFFLIEWQKPLLILLLFFSLPILPSVQFT